MEIFDAWPSLFVLGATGVGVCRLVTRQRSGSGVAGLDRLVTPRPRGPKVQELVGLVAERHHAGPMAFSPDGKVLALPKTDDGRVELWTLETGKVEVLFSSSNKEAAAAESVAFSDDGRLLAASYRRTGIALSDAVARRERAFIPVTPPTG